MAGCEQREECQFFHRIRSGSKPLFRKYLDHYCRGRSASDCLRRVHEEIYGETPVDHLAPCGLVIQLD